MYNPYNTNMYMQELQGMRDRIDRTMQQYQQTQAQQPVQPITQNFQIAPQQQQIELEGKYANNIDEVKNTFVMKTGIFATKDFSTIWVKDISGKIRTYKTEEIIEMDEKDKEIYMLKKEIQEMKGMIKDANKSNITDVDDEITEQKPSRVQTRKRSNED